MVYTITFNPSLDYFVTVDDFRLAYTNRTKTELMLPGGKGINVSTVLSNLGVETSAIYYSAGFVGDEITRRIKELGIQAEEIRLDKGCSRINVKLLSVEGTEINGMGPEISEADIDRLYGKLKDVNSDDMIVLAGSIPSTMPQSIYSDIMERLKDSGAKIVVDATGELLMNVLKYKPLLVKPNNHELGEIFGVNLTTRESVVPYAEELRKLGAENVIVSMAGEGAVYIDSTGKVYMTKAPEGRLVNGVGAGDSMVAGFIAGYLSGKGPEYAFKLGVSAGSASAFSEYLATGEEIRKVYEQIR